MLELARELADWVRATRRPAVLHLRTVRYLGHAGADVESAYRTPQTIRADYARDPLLATAAWLVARGRAHRRASSSSDYLEPASACAGARSTRRARPQLEPGPR